MNPIPLLSDRDMDAPLAWRHGVPVSARQFLADVARFAPELEAGGPVINLCVDRYAFAVSLAAALVRGETSLLPPDARPDTLARLVEAGGHTFAIVDAQQTETPGMPRILIENRPPVADAGDPPVPRIASRLTVLLVTGEAKLKVLEQPAGLPIAALLSASDARLHILWAP